YGCPSPKIQPVARKTADSAAVTVVFRFHSACRSSARGSFSGNTLSPSNAPACSSSSMLAFPYTVIFEAPKFTLASRTPGRALTFCSNFAAQFAQENPCTRYTVLAAASSDMGLSFLPVFQRQQHQLPHVFVVQRVEHQLAFLAVLRQPHMMEKPQMVRRVGHGRADD